MRALAAGVDLPLYDVHGGPVRTHETILKGIDKGGGGGQARAPRDGAKGGARSPARRALRGNPRRRRRLARRDDDALLGEAAKRAVRVLGVLPRLEPGESLTLVSAGGAVGGAASDKTDTPAEALARRLEAYGFRVRRVFYDRDAPDAADALQEGARDTTLFVSTARTRMADVEVTFARAARAAANRFVHVALWNPYHVQDLPGPAVVSFGFRDPSVEAVAEVLLRGRAPGGAWPVGLEPWRDG